MGATFAAAGNVVAFWGVVFMSNICIYNFGDRAGGAAASAQNPLAGIHARAHRTADEWKWASAPGLAV